MKKLKDIATYEATAYAIEILRIVLAVQFGRNLNFGQHNIKVGAECKHGGTKGHEWETKGVIFNGAIQLTAADGSTEIIHHLYAEIELSSYTRIWRTNRVHFDNQSPDFYRRYIGHSIYGKNDRPFNDVLYPSLIVTTRVGGSRDPWRVGTTASNVEDVPFCSLGDIPAIKGIEGRF